MARNNIAILAIFCKCLEHIQFSVDNKRYDYNVATDGGELRSWNVLSA